MFRDDKPLWMPEGSVRGLLAMGLVLGITGFLLLTGQEVPDALWGLDGTVVGFYFATAPKRVQGDERD